MCEGVFRSQTTEDQYNTVPATKELPASLNGQNMPINFRTDGHPCPCLDHQLMAVEHTQNFALQSVLEKTPAHKWLPLNNHSDSHPN